MESWRVGKMESCKGGMVGKWDDELMERWKGGKLITFPETYRLPLLALPQKPEMPPGF